jgi:para-nitrobenzyl esterase
MKKKNKIIALLLSAVMMTSMTSFYTAPQQVSANQQINTQVAAVYKPSIVQETKYGKVKGIKDELNQALVWKGIPYGGATTGEQRWKKPVDPIKWSGELDATKPGDVAIQLSGKNIIGSESALNLDIYRPDNANSKLPVFVYIHGGNNQTGISGEITGNSFVKDMNAIFISVNYRLGPLGFNPLPALNTGDKLEDSGNYALLDIAKSLDWVKENIAQFGGDANNITLSGFSAGGRDVMAILASPVFKGKFQKAISFSGGMSIANKEDSAKVFAKAIAPLVVEDKVKATEGEAYQWLLTTGSDVKDYLYSVPAEKLAKLMGNAGIRMSVFPHLYNDGYVLPKEGFNTTTYNSVPLLMLTGANEFSLFGRFDAYFAKDVANNEINTNPSKVAEYDFVNKYGGELYSLFNVKESAQKMAPFYKSDIYGLEINFGKDAYVAGKELATFGAFHGVFVPLLAPDNQNYATLVGDGYKTEGAKDLSRVFRSYIGNFLKTGNPNGQGLNSWKPWTNSNEMDGQSFMILDANRFKALAYMSNKPYTYESVLNAMDQDHSISAESKQNIISKVLNGRWFSKRLDQKYSNPSLWVK